MITFHMLTICGESIHKTLEYIFRASLYDERFPSEWKNGNVVPIHKKDDYHILKNYRVVPLLQICSKIFERIIYNKIFKHLTENNLIIENQSRFKPGYSCINQLLLMTRDISKSFDDDFEVKKCSLIFLKRLIKFGMKFSFTN